MKIRNKELLDKYIDRHSNARSALQHWIDFVEEAKWKSPSELKADFPSADYVGKERYVFNIQGNNHRLVTVVVFIEGYLKILFVGTHAEYDKINCRTV